MSHKFKVGDVIRRIKEPNGLTPTVVATLYDEGLDVDLVVKFDSDDSCGLRRSVEYELVPPPERFLKVGKKYRYTKYDSSTIDFEVVEIRGVYAIGWRVDTHIPFPHQQTTAQSPLSASWKELSQ